MTLCICEKESQAEPRISQYFPNSIPTKSQTDELTAAGAEQTTESDHGFRILDFGRRGAEDMENRNVIPIFEHSGLEIPNFDRAVFWDSI